MCHSKIFVESSLDSASAHEHVVWLPDDGSVGGTESVRGRTGASDPGVVNPDVASVFASVGARHVVLTTSGDWLRSLAVFLRRRQR